MRGPAGHAGGEGVTSDALKQIKDVDAPKEIADDWDVLSGAMVTLLEAMQDLDLTSAEGGAEMSDLAEDLMSEKVQTAGDNVDAFIAENCEA